MNFDFSIIVSLFTVFAMEESSVGTVHTLTSQVGGHAGVLTTEDGSLLIKPALPVELEFYQKLDTDPIFEHLLPFLPKFLGTLKLEGQVDKSKPAVEGIAITPVSGHKDEFTLRSHVNTWFIVHSKHNP